MHKQIFNYYWVLLYMILINTIFFCIIVNFCSGKECLLFSDDSAFPQIEKKIPAQKTENISQSVRLGTSSTATGLNRGFKRIAKGP